MGSKTLFTESILAISFYNFFPKLFVCYHRERAVEDGIVTEIGDYALRGCSGLREIELPAGLRRIGEGAFRDCSSLETVTLSQVTAVGELAFAGCVLVSGISGEGMTLTGLLIGLGSGIGYGLYSILGTIALRKYSPFTVTTYTFLFAAAGSWIICKPGDMVSKFTAAPNPMWLLFFCCLTALVTAVIPFLAYTMGLRTVEASKAGIIATIEPMVATLVGILVFSEPLTFLSGLGILLILSAVIVLNWKRRQI